MDASEDETIARETETRDRDRDRDRESESERERTMWRDNTKTEWGRVTQNRTRRAVKPGTIQFAPSPLRVLPPFHPL